MKKFMRIILVLLVVLPLQTMDAGADRRGHVGHRGGGHGSVGVFISPGWGWWGWPSYPYYPYYNYPYYPPPVVVREPTDMYVQPSPQAEEPRYWYYCPDARGYYPDVKKCPQGWLKVVPPSEPPAGKE